MGICFQSVTYLLCILFIGTTCQHLHNNEAFGVENIRERRQAGYVYDRPTISFNLPSRPNVGSTSTQATNVDRTSAQQMYYAYPAPAGGSAVNTGYSNTGSAATATATSGATGYNYNTATQNTAIGSTGGTISTITGSDSAGYSYGGTQNTALGSGTGGTISVASGTGGGEGSIGYSYSGAFQNTATGSVRSTSSTVGSGTGSSGYNYGGAVQNTATGSVGSTSNTVGSGSSSSGYNYGGATQNTLSGSSGTTGAVAEVGGLTSAGYKYETQNTLNRGTQTVTNSVSSLYNTPSTGSNVAVTVDSISTNAPEYLPPSSGGGIVDVNVVTDSESVSRPPAVTPSDMYLPPVQRGPSVSVTQTGGNGNVPSVNIVTQSSNAPISGPSVSYLQPSTQQQVTNVQSSPTQVTGHTAGSVQAIPTQDYLPPVVNTGTQVSISTPAASYLPPVF